MSDSLRPHALQHARLLCPSLPPGGCPNSCPLSLWCYLTSSSSAAPFSFGLQSFPASGSFPISWIFTSGGQSIGVSASASVLPMITQSWFLLELTGWFPCSPRDSRVFSNNTVQSINSSALSLLYGPTVISIHDYWKNHSFDYADLQ